MAEIRRHKVFISFHEDDVRYRDQLVRRLKGDIVDKSVHVDDIDDRDLKTETIRRRIREDFIADASVTIVLVGPGTWRRKHVDWEIAASLRHTRANPRCGLLGIILPNHPDTRPGYLRGNLMPARLYDNARSDVGYATMHRWDSLNGTRELRWWIQQAFERRATVDPRNSRPLRRKNSPRRTPGWANASPANRVYVQRRHFVQKASPSGRSKRIQGRKRSTARHRRRP